MYDKQGKALIGKTKTAIAKAEGEILATLEAEYGVTQTEAINDLIEDTCWSNHPRLKSFRGYQGQAKERRLAVLQAFADDGI
jgi:hypothetical protein